MRWLLLVIIIKEHNVFVKLVLLSANIGFYLFKNDMVNINETSFNMKWKSIKRFTDTIGWILKKTILVFVKLILLLSGFML